MFAGNRLSMRDTVKTLLLQVLISVKRPAIREKPAIGGACFT
jgi:hypothetical protein